MKLASAFLTTIMILAVPVAHSRDTQHMLSIEEAMQTSDFKKRLDPSIALYFGSQRHAKVQQTLGDFVTNKKTNALNKTDEEACRWVLLSALLSLQERAKKEGANAVINIASYYKKNKISSNTRYECHSGAIMAGVALTGEMVKLAK
jgi:uncharacterized protein YbjQ (UPF0145 family)